MMSTSSTWWKDVSSSTNVFFPMGGEYPDPTGLCAQAINKAQERINDQKFRRDLQDLVIEKLYNAGVKNYPEFKVFLTGYAHFFNVNNGLRTMQR
jgi:hypothetical protein